MDDIRLGFFEHAIEVGIVFRNSAADGELFCHERFPIANRNHESIAELLDFADMLVCDLAASDQGDSEFHGASLKFAGRRRKAMGDVSSSPDDGRCKSIKQLSFQCNIFEFPGGRMPWGDRGAWLVLKFILTLFLE
jgi:hypothetical protein